MRAIGRQGGESYLLIQGDDLGVLKDPRPAARVYNVETGVLFAPRNAHSILKFGYWDEIDLDDAAVRELLAGATEIRGPGIDEPWEIFRPAARATKEKVAA
jgi:hypothetical protein